MQIFVSIDNINMTALHLFNDSIVYQQGGFSQKENYKIIEGFFFSFLTPFRLRDIVLVLTSSDRKNNI